MSNKCSINRYSRRELKAGSHSDHSPIGTLGGRSVTLCQVTEITGTS